MLLTDRLKNHRILLASKSPRRRELLAGCGIAFEITEGRDAEECFPADMPLGEVAEYLSKIKSDAYADTLTEGDILITADTVVIASDEILGKPKDREDAARMLRLLSGAEHEVVTGVTLRATGKCESFSSVSKVRFRGLTEEEIYHYIDTYKPYDKAGAYGIQEWIGYVAISGIVGSFYNVMGLPVQRLWVELEKFV
ncbi:MAG: septum formation protein Maf [Tidjanibacter sp.]|nr:septum formation protein Maf [Tidjanibacter sp.]